MIQWLATRTIPWRGIGLVALFLLPWGATWWQAHQRGKAEKALTVATARVAALEAAGQAQDAQHRLEERAWLNATQRFADETTKRIEDRIRARDSLAARLCGGALARRSDVPAVAPSAGGSDGPAAEPRSEGEAVDHLDRACGIDAEWLAFWQRYAATVGVEVIAPR